MGKQKTIPPDTALLDIYFENSPKSPLTSQVPAEHYDFLAYHKKSIYLDIENAHDKLLAILTLWESIQVKNIILYLPDNLIQDDNALEHILHSLLNALHYNIYKETRKVVITHSNKPFKKLQNTIDLILNVQLARKLSMTPPNKATPQYMAKTLKTIFALQPNTSIKILAHKQLKPFGLIRSVGESAANPPRFLVIEHLPNPKLPTVCIIGKGITFDSGGLSLKSYNGIKSMKFDKVGAVNGAIALLQLIQEKVPANLIGLFPFAENAVSQYASRHGDVVTSYSGKTVEITDPDAEGRLVLADALSYSAQYKPDLIIDIATLTGHAERINCWHTGYYFATPEPLKHQFEKLTDEIGERMIPMPTWTEYKEVLNSPVADLVNSPNNGNCSDAFVAALFLKEFVPPQAQWVHIDLSHEYEKDAIPKGNGIRSIVYLVEEWLKTNPSSKK